MSDEVLLLKVTAYDSRTVGSVDAPPLPGGEIDDVPFTWSWIAVPQVVYAAATGAGWSTRPEHDPPNVHIPGLLGGPISYNRSLFEGVDPLTPGAASFGSIELTDPDGEVDEKLRPLLWASATVEILRGEEGSSPADFDSVAMMAGDEPNLDLETKTLPVNDLGGLLTDAPLHDIRYAGTGGYEGDLRLKDQLRLMVLGGPVTNITLVRLLDDYPIFEASCTPVHDFGEVRDGGGALDFSGVDHPDFDSLLQACIDLTIAGGEYDTCKAVGLLATGDEPVKDLTADVTGDSSTVNGFGRPVTRADIVRRIVTGYGSYKLAADQLDEATFTAMDAGQPADCGFFFPSEEITKADALTRVMKGCHGLKWTGLNGLLKVGYLDDVPTSIEGSISAPVEGEALVGYKMVGLPKRVASDTPVQAVYLGYAYNYTKQDSGALLDSVGPSDRARFGDRCKLVSSVNEALAAVVPNAPIVILEETGFVNEDDAQAEADRIRRVRGRQLERWAMDVEVDAFMDPLGLAWSVLNVARSFGRARYSFGDERPMLAVGASASTTGENVATWELLG